MKKIITCLSLLTLTLSAGAQGVEIMEQGETTDVSGTVIELTEGEASMSYNFEIKNVSGAVMNVRIERLRIMEVDGTGDYLCWGLDCYDEDIVSSQNPFISPDAIDINNDEMAILFTYHETNDVSGCVQYRYYAVDEDDNRRDSVDVMFCSTVSIEEDEKFEISIFPNPASDFVNVNLDETVQNVGFELYNVLGNVVMTKNLNKGQNTLSVASLPNGVYFYTIMYEGNAVETKKLVVRH